MGLVEKATNNLTRRIESADAEFFFPLVATNEQDFKSVLVKKVLPLVIAFTGLSGLFVTGVPGIGKTPWCCGIAMREPRGEPQGGPGGSGSPGKSQKEDQEVQGAQGTARRRAKRFREPGEEPKGAPGFLKRS